MKLFFPFFFCFPLFAFSQNQNNIWDILESIQYVMVAGSDGPTFRAIENATADALDSTRVTLRGVFEPEKTGPITSNKILFSHHNHWTRGCRVGVPANFIITVVRTTQLRVSHNKACTLQGVLNINWDDPSKPLVVLTDARCLSCD
ncbi:MAG: hypothetical protein GY810_06920 [Aureispira sp.]|nr:hypothetical protein [Aureispira sp.]